MKKFTYLMLFVLMLSAILTACAQPTPTAAPAEPTQAPEAAPAEPTQAPEAAPTEPPAAEATEPPSVVEATEAPATDLKEVAREDTVVLGWSISSPIGVTNPWASPGYTHQEGNNFMWEPLF